jgi:hypothetical protein
MNSFPSNDPSSAQENRHAYANHTHGYHQQDKEGISEFDPAVILNSGYDPGGQSFSPNMSSEEHSSRHGSSRKQYKDATRDTTYYASMITRQGPYIRPYKYQYRLQYSSFNGLKYDPKQLIHEKLDEYQRQFIIELLRSIRPYSITSIHSAIRTRLTPLIAMELLSHDTSRVDKAVAQFYKKITLKNRKGVEWVPWMTGLSDELCIQIIEELSEATDQPTDVLREIFIERKFPPEVAIAFLNATTDEQRVELATTYGMVFPEEDQRHPAWHIGLSHYQKVSLTQRMIEASNHALNYEGCMHLLRKNCKRDTHSHLGKTLLRIEPAHFLHSLMELGRRIEWHWFQDAGDMSSGAPAL